MIRTLDRAQLRALLRAQLRALLGALVLLVWGSLFASAPADAAVRRFALLVSSNEGPKGTQSLLFANADLARMAGVLGELGGYSPGDLHSVPSAQRRQVLSAFGAIRTDIAVAKANGDEVVFLFYYSGHAD
jgi:hypothetical protein